MSIRDELLVIKNEHETLQAESVVEWARRNPGSEIHGALEWNDTEAANQWRLAQVRRLIAIHVVNVEHGYRELVSLSADRVRDGGGYRHIDDVLGIPEMRDILLRDAFNDLDRLQKKYQRLSELASVWAEKEKAKTRIVRRRRSRAEGENLPATA